MAGLGFLAQKAVEVTVFSGGVRKAMVSCSVYTNYVRASAVLGFWVGRRDAWGGERDIYDGVQ